MFAAHPSNLQTDEKDTRTPTWHPSPETLETIGDHYARVAPLMINAFGRIPVIGCAYTHGFDHTPDHIESAPEDAPVDLSPIKVLTHSGTRSYPGLTATTIQWLLRAFQVVELYSWAPTPRDPATPAFARIIVEPHGAAGKRGTIEACKIINASLAGQNLDAAVCLSGVAGAQIWIPLEKAPDYPHLRAWLHSFVNDAITRHGDVLTDKARAERGDKVFLSVSVNAVGRFACLPYSLRAHDWLPAVTPVTWDELEEGIRPFTAHSFAQRLSDKGDVFALEIARIGKQNLPPTSAPLALLQPIVLGCAERRPKGYLIAAILQLLADGKPKSADDLLAEGQSAGIIPDDITKKYVYNAVVSYMGHLQLRGRKAPIVQDADRRFRLNHPVDDWPVEKPASNEPDPSRPVDPATTGVIARLRATSTGVDPTAFERAVCDSLNALGFVVVHVGGNAAPDGYADAPLGRLGYRIMIECKTAKPHGIVNDANVFEAAKFREDYKAQHCMLIGAAFGETELLDSELRTHNVSLWTVDDLTSALAARVNPLELQPAFAAGRAADALWDLIWEMTHGEANRVRVVCRYIQEQGWKAQLMAVNEVAPADAPLLTVDAAMLLVDEQLDRDGCESGCTRSEAEAAFNWLTSPRTALATWVGDSGAIVVARALGEPTTGARMEDSSA